MVLLFDIEHNKLHNIIEELKLLYPMHFFHIFPTVSIKQKIEDLSENLSRETLDLWVNYNYEIVRDFAKQVEKYNDDHIFILNIKDDSISEYFKSLVRDDKYKIITNDILNNEEKYII